MENSTSNAGHSINCQHCSAVNSTDSKFCVSCGFPVKGDEADQKKFLTSKKLKESDLEEYDGKIKSAKTTLFVISGFTAVFGTLMAAIGNDENMILLIVINLIIAGIYLALGFWCTKKPFAAILSGLIIYISLILLNAVNDPKTIYQGLIMKGVIIAYMVKGLKSAKEAETLKKELNIE